MPVRSVADNSVDTPGSQVVDHSFAADFLVVVEFPVVVDNQIVLAVVAGQDIDKAYAVHYLMSFEEDHRLISVSPVVPEAAARLVDYNYLT